MENCEYYFETLESLRELKRTLDVTFIYALKEINGYFYFIFDTEEGIDTVEEIFERYEISDVHERAFRGEFAAGIMNVEDEWGSYNTGAIPIWDKDGNVVGIVSTDIEDILIQRSISTSNRNAIILIITLFITFSGMIVIVSLLLHRLKKIQDRLFRMANYDSLTGLPNRNYLMNYLQELSAKTLSKHTSFAFLLMDLDNFKTVNDSAGHDAGDELLKHIAVYLDNVHGDSKSFRPAAGQLNVSARIGGDEFVQIIPGISTEEEACKVAQKVIANFSSPQLDRFIEKYQVGLSIGVTLFPYNTRNFNVLIKYADIAMYHAKKSGKNTYRFYEDEMSQVERQEPTENAPGNRRRLRR
jgi:diguanylate cyclase (GGDEF)-like protein